MAGSWRKPRDVLHIFLQGNHSLPSALTHLGRGTGQAEPSTGSSSWLQTPPTDRPTSAGSQLRAAAMHLQVEMGLSPGPGGAPLNCSEGLGLLSSQQVSREALTPIQVSFWSADGPAPGLGSDPSPVCRRQPPLQNTLSSASRICLPLVLV